MSPSVLVVFLQGTEDCAKVLGVCVELQVLGQQVSQGFDVATFNQMVQVAVLHFDDEPNSFEVLHKV